MLRMEISVGQAELNTHEQVRGNPPEEDEGVCQDHPNNGNPEKVLEWCENLEARIYMIMLGRKFQTKM